MKIHVIRSEEVSESFYDEVMSMLGSFRGPAAFIRDDNKLSWQNDELEDIDWDDEEYFKKKEIEYSISTNACMISESRYIARWPDIFEKTAEYRRKEQIPDDELIVMLTSHNNEYNWFSAGNPDGSQDFFVHTGMWDLFIDSDPRFPVVYQLLALALRMAMFGSYSSYAKNTHKDTRGCINDFCKDKRDIVMKMRTGDICRQCTDRIISENVDPALVRQVLDGFDSIRSHMLFRERYKITRKPYRLEVRGNNKRLYLPELADTKIPLSPMERAVYLLMLNHPEGMPLSHFPDFRDELKRYYSSTSVEGSVATLNERVNAICENQDNLLSQIISRIRRKFTVLVGEEMAESYIIKGERGEARRVELDRAMVEQEKV